MQGRSFRFQAPAKLMLAGEYSVLGPSGLSLSLAIANQGVEAVGQSADVWQIARDDLDLSWQVGQEVPFELSFAHSAWQLARQSSSAPGGPLRICTRNYGAAIAPTGKPGLGSSASAVVAVTAATLGEQALAASSGKERVLDLALKAHQQAQGKRGSGYDVATATLGGLVVWRKNTDGNYSGETITWPTNLHCLAGYCGTSADTRHYLKSFSDWQASDNADVDAELAMLSRPVEEMLQAVTSTDYDQLHHATRRAHDALLEWDRRFEMGIVTVPIAKMIEISQKLKVAAKVSGAGGGDSLIAFSDDRDRLEALAMQWREAGFWPYSVEVDPDGLKQIA
jgi:phosphomevalonate kinase